MSYETIKTSINKRFIVSFITGTIILCMFSLEYIYVAMNKTENPIRSDGDGYYSYLPAIFDYGDLEFNFSDGSQFVGAGI